MMKVLVARLLALAMTAVPSLTFAQQPAPAEEAAVELPAPPPASPDFYPSRYLGQGDAFNCADFVSQADAQAVLRANPTDPNKLDTDRPRPDGVACESNRAPFDRVAVPR